MKVATRTKNTTLYMTWYDFKKDLERRSGHSILNEDWFRVKPKTHLPWTSANLQSSLLKLTRKNERKNVLRHTTQVPC